MVTEYESDRLIRLLSQRNNNIALNGTGYSFNSAENRIETITAHCIYEGSRTSIDMKKRMLVKASRQLAYEAHLQAFILQNCDRAPLNILTAQLPNTPLWIGNEVSCGVGMQSIDVMLSQENEETVFFNIIELKCAEPNDGIITRQLPWYVAWVKDYLIPLYHYNKRIIITPTILAPKIQNAKQLQIYKDKCLTFESGVFDLSFSFLTF